MSPSKSARWPRTLRWGKRIALVLVVLALALRLAVPLLLPGALQRVAAERGLSLEYEKLDISILAGSFELWNLQLRKAPGEAEEAGQAGALHSELEYVAADVDLSSLFLGDLLLHRAEVDGLDVYLSRRSLETGWSWAGLVDATSPPIEEPVVEASEAQAPFQGYDLSLPLKLRALRLQHLQLHVQDEALEPAFQTRLELNVRLSNLGLENRPARLEVFAHSEEWLDSFSIEGSLEGTSSELRAKLECRLSGLQPLGLGAYLEPMGLRPSAEELELGMHAELKLETHGEDALELGLEASLRDVELRADGRECLALDALELGVPTWSPEQVRIETSSLRGVRALLSRSAEGLFGVAGMELIGRPTRESNQVHSQAPAQGPNGPVDALEEPPSPWPSVAIQAIALQDFGVRFEDQAVAPSATLEWSLEQAELRNIKFDPALPAEDISVSASMASEGLFQSLKLEGHLSPFGDSQGCELDLTAEGILLEALNPYLGPLGLRSAFTEGSFKGHLSARVQRDAGGVLRADLSLEEIQLADQGELFALDALRVTGLQHDPESGSTSMEEVLLDGTRLALHRDEDRSLHFFGLATGAGAAPLAAQPSGQAAPAAASRPPSAPTGESAEATSSSLPKLSIKRVAWTHSSIGFSDVSLAQPAALQLDDLGFEMLGLELGGAAQDAGRAPATFKLWLTEPDLAEQLQCEGSLQVTPGPLDLDVELACTGRGLSYEALRPWLMELGIEPELQNGSLNLQLEAQLQQAGQGLTGSVALRDLHFGEEDETFLALGALELPSFEFGPTKRHIEALRIKAPELSMARDASGALQVLGLRLPTQVAGEDEQNASAAQAPVANAGGSGGGEAPSATADAGPMFVLDELSVAGLAVHWRDQFVEGGFETTLGLTASSGPIEYGAGAGESKYAVELSMADVLDSLSFQGQVQLDPKALDLRGELSMQGLRGSSLGPYLSPGMELPLADGRLRMLLDASLGERPAGDGRMASLELTELDYREHGSSQAFLGFERLACVIPMMNPEERRYEIDEVALSGLELDLRRGERGEWRLLGLALDPALAEAAELKGPTEPAPAPVIEAGASMPPALPQATAAPPTATDPIAAPAAPPIPTVQLNQFDVGIAHLRFLDESQAAATPLDVQLRLTTPGPVTLISPQAEALPALELSLAGSAVPLMDSLQTRLQLTPFQPEPGLRLELALDGIRGAQLTKVLPGLEEVLDASALSDGQFTMELESHLIARRRSPVDFDLAAGFGLELELKEFAYLDQPGGELLAGMESISASVKSIRPKTGDVHIERVEIVKPSVHAVKTAEGVSFLGLLLKNPAATELETESAPAASAPELAEAPPAEASPEAPEAKQASELRLDEFLISGADLSYVDRSVEPALELPISDLDLELKRFSTRSLESEQPFRFSATLYGGDIQLAERNAAGNLVGGMLGSLGSLVTDTDELEYEARPVFDEISLRGNLSLGPEPKGWTQLRLRALELPALRGLAKESGVDIGDGLMNETAMLHFDGEGGMRVSSQTHFSYLSLSEPPGGPISSYLRLPAPVDTVLFVLRDEEGDLNVPLHVSLGEEGLSTATLLAAVSRTLGLVIGDAIASSPMKIIGGVVDLAGLGGEPLELDGSESVRLEFAQGEVVPPAGMTPQLEPLLELLRSDESLYLVVEHQLSAQDLSTCTLLANPPAADCLDLAANLRLQRALLLAKRASLAASVSTSYATGNLEAAKAGRSSLRAIEVQLGTLEAGLDRVLELTRPGAERGKARRAKSTAMELARRRLEAVSQQLRSAPIESIATRVDERRPRFGVTPGLELGTVLVSVRRRN